MPLSHRVHFQLHTSITSRCQSRSLHYSSCFRATHISVHRSVPTSPAHPNRGCPSIPRLITVSACQCPASNFTPQPHLITMFNVRTSCWLSLDASVVQACLHVCMMLPLQQQNERNKEDNDDHALRQQGDDGADRWRRHEWNGSCTALPHGESDEGPHRTKEPLHHHGGRETVTDATELCNLAIDFNTEMKSTIVKTAKEKVYELPEDTINACSGCYRHPEVLLWRVALLPEEIHSTAILSGRRTMPKACRIWTVRSMSPRDHQIQPLLTQRGRSSERSGR